MEIINGMKIFTIDEITERKFGPIGTPERDAFEREMKLMEIRHLAALKAAQTRKRNREEALRQAKEKEAENNIEYVINLETNPQQQDLTHIPINMIHEEQLKHNTQNIYGK